MPLPHPSLPDSEVRRNFEAVDGRFPVGSANIASLPAARVYKGSAQAIATATVTAVQFDNERFDTQSLHDNATNNTRLTAPIAGLYAISFHVQWAANATGVRAIAVRLNGTTNIAGDTDPAIAGTDLTMSVACLYKLAANDYVEGTAFQTSGADLNVNASGNLSPEMAMTWLHPA